MGFRIDGSDYEIPELDSFTMGEAFILYQKTASPGIPGLSLADFALDEEDPKQAEALRRNLLHPGTVLTRMIVAYMRGNPGASQGTAEALLERANWLQSYVEYAAGLGADASPPDQTPTAPPAVGVEMGSSNGPSGGTSPEGLAAQEDPRAVTGTSA